jgi:hypothetical protein
MILIAKTRHTLTQIHFSATSTTLKSRADNIKPKLKEMVPEGADWICLAQGKIVSRILSCGTGNYF